MFTLIVAEKPSVAKDIARIVGAQTRGRACFSGSGYRVTWCIGHLLESCEPHEYDGKWKRWTLNHLPILPNVFLYHPIAKTRAHLNVLVQHFRASDVNTIINACDAGREGELIFRLVAEHANVHKPLKRLWISSLTDVAIRDGLQTLLPSSQFDSLADAARCRTEADWLVGMNATRAMTLTARQAGIVDTLFSIGRVQTPTLALLVERENTIREFVPEPFWTLTGHFRSLTNHETRKTYLGTWFRDKQTRLPTADEARQLAAAIENKPGTVTSLDVQDVRERPPLLFDLTELQRVANRRFGMSAKKTLDVAQRLYEHHKLITYPRTDSRYLTSDQRSQIQVLVNKLEQTDCSPWVEAMLRDRRMDLRRIVDDSEVGDHHAIIPTGSKSKNNTLDFDERRIFELVVRRFLAVQMNDARFQRTEVITDVFGHLFRSVGKVRLAEGWHALEPPAPKPEKKLSDSSVPADEDQILPALVAGENVFCYQADVRKGETTPPKRFTEATLLTAMERAGQDIAEEELRHAMKESGLGTPATRAPIIETLLQREYIIRDGKSLVPTELGCLLIRVLPIAELRSAQLTGKWEAALSRIARGELRRSDFMEDVAAYTRNMVAQFGSKIAAPPFAPFVKQEIEVVGKCPLCERDVVRQRQGYVCSGKPDCKVAIPRQVASKPVTVEMAKHLLNRGRTAVVSGFRSSAGKTFSACLVLKPDGDVGFAFDSQPSKPSRRVVPPRSPEVPTAPPVCPLCNQGTIVRGRQAWGCSRWRDGCIFVVAFEHNSVPIPESEAFAMMRFGATAKIPKLCGRAGGKLVLDLSGPPFVRITKAVDLKKPPLTYTKRTVKPSRGRKKSR
ncbi:MAG: DNA topoisomerase 3 [Myxococcales bacterium]|nr:DNA topoisomerase 3 [Myxococcales bacterium]